MTPRQEKKVTFLLKRARDLKKYVAINKGELLNIKQLKATETSRDRLVEMENKLIIGQNLVNEQLKELEGLSRVDIANKAKANYWEVCKFDMKEPNWRKEK